MMLAAFNQAFTSTRINQHGPVCSVNHHQSFEGGSQLLKHLKLVMMTKETDVAPHANGGVLNALPISVSMYAQIF